MTHDDEDTHASKDFFDLEENDIYGIIGDSGETIEAGVSSNHKGTKETNITESTKHDEIHDEEVTSTNMDHIPGEKSNVRPQ